MLLLQKTNNDWWSARKATGHEGYVPANYVKEVEPKVVKKKVKRTVKVSSKSFKVFDMVSVYINFVLKARMQTLSAGHHIFCI